MNKFKNLLPNHVLHQISEHCAKLGKESVKPFCYFSYVCHFGWPTYVTQTKLKARCQTMLHIKFEIQRHRFYQKILNNCSWIMEFGQQTQRYHKSCTATPSQWAKKNRIVTSTCEFKGSYSNKMNCSFVKNNLIQYLL